MATVPTIDSLNKDERAMIVEGLNYLSASRKRALNATSDEEMKSLIARRLAAVDALITRFR